MVHLERKLAVWRDANRPSIKMDVCNPEQPGARMCTIVAASGQVNRSPEIPKECVMNLLVLLIVLLLLFGGGGFYLGGPLVGGSLGGLILIILVVLVLTGGLSSRA